MGGLGNQCSAWKPTETWRNWCWQKTADQLFESADLHPDGKQLVFTNSEYSDEIWGLKNLLNGVKTSR